MKLITRNSHRGKSAVALVERMHAIWTLSRDGSRRTGALPPYALNTPQNYFTSNTVAGNMMFDALDRGILGYFQVGDIELDEDQFAIAIWNDTDQTFEIGPAFGTQTSSNDNYETAKPRPVHLANDGTGTHVTEGFGFPITYCGYYATIQTNDLTNFYTAGGAILHFDSYEDPVDNRTDFDDWILRTATDVEIDDGTHFGYGQTASFHDSLDLVHHDPGAATLWPTSLYSDRHDIDANAPGYGHIWYGWPKVLFMHNERWYALARGYITDNADDPLGAVPHNYAANALWRLNVGENPDNPNAWRLVDVFASYDVDNAFNELSDGDLEHNVPHMWVEQYSDCAFFSCPPVLPLDNAFIAEGARGFDETAVYCLQGGTLNKSLNWVDGSCWGGPMAQMGGKLFFPMISVAEQRIFLYRLDSPPSEWILVSDYPLGVSESVDPGHPMIADCFGANGRVYVVYGKHPSILVDAPIAETTGDNTAYKMITWRQAGNSWISLSGGHPQPYWDDPDLGIWPRMWLVKPDDTPEGGGGGGTGTGACDDVFAIHAASTISRASFAAQLDGSATIYGASPLLSEHADPDYWYDLVESYGVDPNYALAMWFKESKYGTVTGEVGAGCHNIGNLRPHSWGHGVGAATITTGCCGVFTCYPNWRYGVEDYCALWDLSIYAGKSISEAIAIYAPRSENDSDLYIQQVCDFMTARAAEP
jgi:hypothetical protein